MSERKHDRRREWPVALIGGVVVHVVLIGGLFAAESMGLGREPRTPEVVTFEIVKPPPKLPPPPPPEPEVAPPPEPPPAVQAPKPEPPRKIPARQPPTPPPPAAEPPPPPMPEVAPAPGPASPAAPTFKMPAAGAPGGMAVPAGEATRGGAGRGAGGGKAPGTGGGGDADSTGTGARPVSIATVKRMPEPIGDYDFASDRLYTPEAKRALVEGKVEFSLVIDETGKVASIKLLRGLGFGLDENAQKFVRGIKFRPAIDSSDRPVATKIPWVVTYKLPDE